MKSFLQHLFALLLAPLVTLHAASPVPPKPNILVILTDDLGYDDVGCYWMPDNRPGFEKIRTPNLDRLAAEGARFTDYYAPSSVCTPSRAALMTGCYPVRVGMSSFGRNGAQVLYEAHMEDRLRDSGYATGLVGKWHLGGTAEFHPQRRGFDEFFGFLHEGHFYVPQPWQGVTTWLRRKTLPDGGQGRWTSPDGRIVWSTHLGSNEPEYDTDNPLLRSSQPVDEQANLTDAFTREACDFIARHSAQPFFLYLAYNAVHSPMQATDDYMKKFAHIEDIQRRIFAAMLAHLDDSVGKVLAQLRDSGIEENTLVVFLSDNGGPTKELTSSNAPLRGGKGELCDGGIRVPFIASWKNHINAGQVIDAPVASIDATATALKVAGALAPEPSTKAEAKLDGINLIPMLTGKTKQLPERPLFWRVGKKNALRLGDWKLIRDGKEWQLYDLTHDISETRNLATQEPSRVQQMSALWDKWNAEQIDPLWK